MHLRISLKKPKMSKKKKKVKKRKKKVQSIVGEIGLELYFMTHFIHLNFHYMFSSSFVFKYLLIWHKTMYQQTIDLFINLLKFNFFWQSCQMIWWLIITWHLLHKCLVIKKKMTSTKKRTKMKITMKICV